MDELKKILSKEITAEQLDQLNAMRESFLAAINNLELTSEDIKAIKDKLAGEAPAQESLEDVILAEDEE